MKCVFILMACLLLAATAATFEAAPGQQVELGQRDIDLGLPSLQEVTKRGWRRRISKHYRKVAKVVRVVSKGKAVVAGVKAVAAALQAAAPAAGR